MYSITVHIVESVTIVCEVMCVLGLCIFDLFSPKILISRERMNFCIKTRKQAIFLDYFKKSPRTNQKIY